MDLDAELQDDYEAEEDTREQQQLQEREASPGERQDAGNAFENMFDNDEDEEEQDSEEEEELDESNTGQRKKKRRKIAGNRFIDIEAEVDEDDEEDEEEEEMGAGEGFLAENDEGIDGTDKYHRSLDRTRQSLADKDAAQIAREIEERDRMRRQAAQAVDEMGGGTLTQHVVMPDVNDPTIWAIKVKPGKEREIILAVSNKAATTKINIISAFHRESLKGYIYVEANHESAVLDALHGLIGVYVSNAPLLIPLEERSSLLTTQQKEPELHVGGWVRFKRGKHAGDIAQILEIPENSGLLSLKYIPRIDFNPPDKEEEEFKNKDGSERKRKKRGPGANAALFRPPARLFNAEDVKSTFGAKTVSYQRGYFQYGGDEFKDGFCIKDHRIATLVLEDVNPTIDEITKFAADKSTNQRKPRGEDDDDEEPQDPADAALNLNLIADATKRAAKGALQPGDHVEIYKGGQKGLTGIIRTVRDELLSILPDKSAGLDLGDDAVEVEADYVRKRFKVGDHVRVLTGVRAGERGLVVAVEDGEVTLVSSQTGAEIKVFSKDVREATESDETAVQQLAYELHDLVQIDPQTAGVIFKIENDLFYILDQQRTIKKLKAHQIPNKVAGNNQIATDKDGSVITKGDNMKEAGEQLLVPREGKVLHSYRSLFTWLYNRSYTENSGVFVCYSQILVSENIRAIARKKMDSTSMNPAVLMPPPALPTPNMANGLKRRDPLLGQRVRIGGKTEHKGKEGKVKDVNGAMYRVELSATNKLVNISQAQLFVYNMQGGQEPAGDWLLRIAGMRKAANTSSSAASNAGDGRTPGGSAIPQLAVTNQIYNSGGKTPNVWAQSKLAQTGSATTYNASSRTPLQGGATPYSGNKTPSYNASSKNDPWAAGARTPAASGIASMKSSVNSSSANGHSTTTPRSGWSTDTPASSSEPRSNYRQYDTPAASDYPSVGSSKTPYASAPTPAAQSAPTPRFAEEGYTPRDAPSPAPQSRNSYINPDRQRMQQASSYADTPADSSYYQDSSSYSSGPSHGRRDVRQQTGANTSALTNNRWGQASASAAANASTPGVYKSAATPGASDAPTPGKSTYSRPTPGASYNAKTPGAHNAATPHSAQTPANYGTPALYNDAQTPGVGGSQHVALQDEVVSLPRDWPEAGLRVEVGDDEFGNPHQSGRLNGQQAHVTDVYRDTAAVLLCKLRLSGSEDVVPAKFLRPIAPATMGTPCIVISTGKYRRMQVTADYQNEEVWSCTFSNGGKAFLEARFLCVYDPDLKAQIGK